MFRTITDYVSYYLPNNDSHLPRDAEYQLKIRNIPIISYSVELAKKYPIAEGINHLADNGALTTKNYVLLLRKPHLADNIARGLAVLEYGKIATEINCDKLIDFLYDRPHIFEKLKLIMSQQIFDCLVKHKNRLTIHTAIICMHNKNLLQGADGQYNLERLSDYPEIIPSLIKSYTDNLLNQMSFNALINTAKVTREISADIASNEIKTITNDTPAKTPPATPSQAGLFAVTMAPEPIADQQPEPAPDAAIKSALS